MSVAGCIVTDLADRRSADQHQAPTHPSFGAISMQLSGTRRATFPIRGAKQGALSVLLIISDDIRFGYTGTVRLFALLSPKSSTGWSCRIYACRIRGEKGGDTFLVLGVRRVPARRSDL